MLSRMTQASVEHVAGLGGVACLVFVGSDARASSVLGLIAVFSLAARARYR